MTFRVLRMARYGALVSTLALAVAAAACGGGSSSADNTSTPSSAGSGAPAATASRSPAQADSGGAYGASTQASTDGAASVTLRDTTLGNVLADGAGMTLYTFKNDTKGSGKSACSGGCATNWPPLVVTGGAPSKPAGLTGDLTVITRDDGSMQVAYDGLPLYRFAADKGPGDTKGDGVGGIWSAAKP